MTLMWTMLALAVAAPQELARVDQANLQCPRFSPNGAQLSYEANFHERKTIELFVGSPKGSFTAVKPPAWAQSSQLTAGFSKSTASSVVHDLAWAPPSIGRYVYVSTDASQDYELYIQGGGAVASAPGADGSPAWSPDGRFIAFTSARTGQGDLYLLDVNNIEQPALRLTKDPSHSELDASWAPDSKRLVYVGHSNTGDNLWLLPDTQGAAPVQLTSWGGSQTRPRFSPDGSKVAFYANKDQEDRFDLYVMEAKAGATPKRLATGIVPNADGPVFEPGGAKLVFVRDDDDRFDPLQVVDVSGGTPRDLPVDTVGHGDHDLVRGPNGKLELAYVAQGRRDDTQRTFKRLYLAELDAL